MASWIEMKSMHAEKQSEQSRLMWPRGLKYDPEKGKTFSGEVEAYVASWIEIHIPIFKTPFPCVEAYVASWIEISMI